MVDEAILASQRVVPTALIEAGFVFESPSIESILTSAFS
jgi:NAD dependent epimerase/dehydratase family enzyme